MKYPISQKARSMREGQELETKLSPPKKNGKEKKGGGKEEKVIR